jgi:hypothetical protein
MRPTHATRTQVSSTPARRTTSPTVDREEEEEEYVDEPTPRPRAPGKGHAPSRSQPNIQLHPPTPSDSPFSTFTKHAKHLEGEIAAEKNRVNALKQRSRTATDGPPPRSTPRVQISVDVPPTRKTPNSVPRTVSFDIREPHHSRSSIDIDVRPGPGKAAAGTPLRVDRHGHSVHLPDVTGLTSAVDSPARLVREYRKYRENEDARVIEARLVTALNTVQSKLAQIEAENSVSRRRVRELEMELEACKEDVKRERTRVLEREEVMMRKQRAAEVEEESEMRYKQAVEEKKGRVLFLTEENKDAYRTVQR